MSFLIKFNKLAVFKHVQGTILPLTAPNRLMQSITLKYESDPSYHFADEETQKLLKSMTQLDVAKLFKKRTTENNEMKYKFMTTEELEGTIRETLKKCQKRLQMVPIIPIKEDKPHIISKDDELNGFSEHKYVITDIT